MKEIEMSEVMLHHEPNDILMGMKILLNLEILQNHRELFCNQLRGIFQNEKFEKSSLRILALHIVHFLSN